MPRTRRTLTQVVGVLKYMHVVRTSTQVHRRSTETGRWVLDPFILRFGSDDGTGRKIIGMGEQLWAVPDLREQAWPALRIYRRQRLPRQLPESTRGPQVLRRPLSTTSI